MASSSRPFTHASDVLPAGNASVAPARNTWSTIFWSPLLLLTAIIHTLCLPRTKKFLLALVVLDIPLQWGTHFSIRPDVASMGAIEGFDFSITTLTLFALYLGWLFTGRATNRPLRILWNWPIVTYTAVVIASIFVAADPQLSLFQIFLTVEMLLLYIYVAGNITSRSEIVYILTLLLVGALIESSYMLITAAAGHEFAFVRMLGMKTNLELPGRAGDLTRLGGTIGSPNYSAAYLAIMATLALAIRQMKVPRSLRRLTIPVIVLGLSALALTYSRGGWIEIVLSVAILSVARWLRYGISWRAIVTLVATVTLIAVTLLTPNAVSSRFFGDDNGSAHSRIPLMHLAYRIIDAHPVLGVGANNFAAVMDDYAGSEFRQEWLYTVHNEFLLVCSETGILGLAAYLWIYFNLIRRGWRLWKTRDELFAPLGLAIVAIILGLFSHMFVDIFSGRGLMQLIWLFAALIAVCELIRGCELPDRMIEVRTR